MATISFPQTQVGHAKAARAKTLSHSLGMILQTVAFLTVIFVPLLMQLLHLRDEVQMNEKRKLEGMPAIGLDAQLIQDFPKRFEAYYNDHFPFRNSLILFNSWLRVQLLGSPLSSSVVIGNEGWLFYANDCIMEDYRGLTPFHPSELAAWRRSLEGKRDWLNERGIAYCFVAAAEKQTIYPEFVPARYNRVSQQTRLDQLLSYLQDRSGPSDYILDLRPALLQAKQHERVYHRTDTHWNDLGAYVGYCTLLERLQRIDPSRRWAPTDRSKFSFVAEQGLGMDLAEMLGLSSSYAEEVLSLLPKSERHIRCEEPISYAGRNWPPGYVNVISCPEGSGTIVMFCDSFATALRRFLIAHAGKIVSIAGRLDGDSLQKVVDAEKPQLVIEERVERFLHREVEYSAPIDSEWRKSRCRKQIAARKDAHERNRLADCVRTQTLPGEPIAVVGDSDSLTEYALGCNESAGRGGGQAPLQFLPLRTVSDDFPLENLFQAETVLVRSPLGNATVADEPETTQFIRELFERRQGSPAEFAMLPEQFRLHGDQGESVVQLYKRSARTTSASLWQTLAQFATFVDQRREHEPSWEMLTQLFSMPTDPVDGVYTTHVGYADRCPFASVVLYRGELPWKGRVRGRLSFLDSRCQGACVKLIGTTATGNPHVLAEASFRPPDKVHAFSLPFHAKDCEHLFLTVTTIEPADTIASGTIVLDRLAL